MHPLAHIQFQTRTSNIKKNLFLQQGLGNPYGLRESHISQTNSAFYSEIKRHHAALSSIIGGGGMFRSDRRCHHFYLLVCGYLQKRKRFVFQLKFFISFCLRLLSCDFLTFPICNWMRHMQILFTPGSNTTQEQGICHPPASYTDCESHQTDGLGPDALVTFPLSSFVCVIMTSDDNTSGFSIKCFVSVYTLAH